MTGFKDFTSTTLSSADVDGYLMAQVVIVCTSGTRPASPHEGMTIYETDTNRYAVYNGGWIYTASTSAASRIGCQVTSPTNSVLTSSIDTGVLETIYWNANSYDQDGMWGGVATNALTIEYDGLYVVDVGLTFTTSWTTGVCFLRLVKGGGSLVGHRLVDSSSGNLGASFGPIALTVGETISVQMWQASGSTKTLSSGSYTVQRISR